MGNAGFYQQPKDGHPFGAPCIPAALLCLHWARGSERFGFSGLGLRVTLGQGLQSVRQGSGWGMKADDLENKPNISEDVLLLKIRNPQP